jgi:hypothetical protein
MEVFDAELWAIGLALGETVKRRERLQKHGVKTVAVFRNSQAAIRQTAHLEPGPGQRLARRINQRAQTLLAQASQPRFTVSRDTSASPETKKQTARRTSLETQAEARR